MTGPDDRFEQPHDEVLDEQGEQIEHVDLDARLAELDAALPPSSDA